MPSDPDFERLLEYIKANRGFDFTGYKRPSLQRRVRKQMAAVGVHSYGEYQEYLRAQPDEFAALFDTILINVTSFFRDPPAWEFVRREIVPQVVESAEGRDIRIWSTGCASGEEAYTLAMVLADAMPSDLGERVKIYATDVDERALSEGRHATYAPAQVEKVPTDLREQHFDRVDGRFVVKPELRRAVIFGRHDVVQDPPISRIDLLTSRNTLMYFTGEAQTRILANFHFALREGGFLLLGKSEMMLSRANLFTAVDLRRRVFQKAARGERFRFVPRLAPEPSQEVHDADSLLRDVAFEASPLAQLVIDRGGRLTLANMHARALFRLASRDVGRPLKDLELSYRPVELRSLIDRAYAERHSVTVRGTEWLEPTGEERVVDVQVTPLVAPTGEFTGVSVSFFDIARSKRLQAAVEVSKREVEVAYEALQSSNEELETTNEELQSTNEELETTNEELQSTNEELETMNEELQSTNEELETMNDELNQRTHELNRTNLFLEGILSAVDAGVVVVDRELRVIAWNDGAHELWGLRGDEVAGQHLLNVDIGFPVERLRAPLRAALAGEPPAEPVVVEATSRRGRQVLVRVRLAPLHAEGDTDGARGAILFMEAEPA